MQVIPLASSSKGNAYLVEHDGAVILIDCGLSYRELKKRLSEKLVKTGQTCFDKFSCDQIMAILITHSHTDHVQGLKTLLGKHDVPVYTNLMTAETIVAEQGVAEDAFVCFENGQEFEIGPFTVSAFSIPHDTSDPVGYLIRARESLAVQCKGAESLYAERPARHSQPLYAERPARLTYFHATDVGMPLDSIGLKLAEADIATLESNHDPVMLKNSGRAPYLIQRIAGPRGHLANWEAAELVKKFASPRLKKLMLAHLSQDCNTPFLAERKMREALEELGRDDIELEILLP